MDVLVFELVAFVDVFGSVFMEELERNLLENLFEEDDLTVVRRFLDSPSLQEIFFILQVIE